MNCITCDGLGVLEIPELDVYGNIIQMKRVPCADCSGRGEIEITDVNETWKDSDLMDVA